MRETHLLVSLFPDLHVATSNGEALESIIYNIHYVGVVFFLVVSGRVKIHGVGDLRVKNDKARCCGEKTPQIILHMSEKE